MRFNLTIATCTLLLSLVAPASRAAVIFSEDFEGVTTGTYQAPSAIGNFSLTAGNVDVLGPTFFGNLCTGATTINCVDLNGNTTGGSLSSGSLTLAAGTYTLAFTLNGSQRGVQTSTTVSLGAAFSNTYVLNDTDTNAFVIPFTVLAPQSDPLTFTSNTLGSIGAILDDVTLFSGTVTPTPEPSVSWLVGMGLVAVSLSSRRLRKA